MSNVLLGLNIDHIATIRNSRKTQYPDPVYAAYIAEQSGIDGITVHLREDRRHITDKDVKLIRSIIQTTMNLEIAITDEMIGIAYEIKPHFCCLVPERRQELTTESGLDLVHSNVDKLRDIVSKLTDYGIRVSLFIDPYERQVDVAYKIGTSCIELNTGMYSSAKTKVIQEKEYQRIKKSSKYAHDYGLIVNAGHGLDYHNVGPIAMITCIQELNIGHSIISRAMFCGLSKAILDMKSLLEKSR